MRADSVQGIETTLAVGCPNVCDYCPQKVLLSKYKGDRVITLDNYKRCMETVPVSRHLTFAGQVEQFVNPDCAQIMKWARDRGHEMSMSTTLSHISHADIDMVASIPMRTTVVHVPADDGKIHMPIDAAYLDRLQHAVNAWKHKPDFIIAVYGQPHPAVLPIWNASGVPIVNYGLHDRAGNLPDLAGVKHDRHRGKLPICGKVLVGHLYPNGDLSLCCNTYSLEVIFGNLFQQSYASCFEGEAFRAFIKKVRSENEDNPCRRCHDSFKSVNVEDRERVRTLEAEFP